jgi:hypothetical protein
MRTTVRRAPDTPSITSTNTALDTTTTASISTNTARKTAYNPFVDTNVPTFLNTTYNAYTDGALDTTSFITTTTTTTTQIVSSASIASPEHDSAGGSKVFVSNEKSDVFANILIHHVISSIWPDRVVLDWVKGRKGDTTLVWTSQYDAILNSPSFLCPFFFLSLSTVLYSSSPSSVPIRSHPHSPPHSFPIVLII